MKKQNPLIQNLTVSISHVHESVVNKYAEAIQMAYDAELLTDQEHADYWLKLTDASKDYSFYNETKNLMMVRLAAHHTAKNEDTDILFKFKTDHGVIDIRPILTAIDWAGGVTGLASIIDTVLFSHIDTLHDIDESDKELIRNLKAFRTMLLRASGSADMDFYHTHMMDNALDQRGPLWLIHLDLDRVKHRIPADEEMKVA
jgi:hypothetical protein